jgi:ornithine cyclodeaminase/alanine dehydrogenase-like protein (mu-crystallin family)
MTDLSSLPNYLPVEDHRNLSGSVESKRHLQSMKSMKEIVIEIITGISIEDWEANNKILEKLVKQNPK